MNKNVACIWECRHRIIKAVGNNITAEGTIVSWVFQTALLTISDSYAAHGSSVFCLWLNSVHAEYARYSQCTQHGNWRAIPFTGVSLLYHIHSNYTSAISIYSSFTHILHCYHPTIFDKKITSTAGTWTGIGHWENARNAHTLFHPIL